MNKLILILILMLLGHLIADYPLQGWLASAKQKVWWKNNALDKKYKYDYIAALVCHSLMWSIFVFAPIMYYSWSELDWFWLALPVNVVLHCVIDDLKANKLKINLIVDQLLHLAQIVITWWLFFMCIGVY